MRRFVFRLSERRTTSLPTYTTSTERAMPQAKPKVSLTFAFYERGAFVPRQSLTEDIVKIGTDPKSHLRIDDAFASRMHALIEVTSRDQLLLTDLDSERGTVVNGARVHKCAIRQGVEIQIGRTLIVLERADVATLSEPLLPGRASQQPHPPRARVRALRDRPRRRCFQCEQWRFRLTERVGRRVRPQGAYYDLSFPQPESGVVSVVYPIVFSPGD